MGFLWVSGLVRVIELGWRIWCARRGRVRRLGCAVLAKFVFAAFFGEE